MNFQWLPITSLQSLFAEFVAALLQAAHSSVKQRAPNYPSPIELNFETE